MNEIIGVQQIVTDRTNKLRDKDGLHKRRGIWHFKLKEVGHWREISTHTSDYQNARKIRHRALQAQEEGRLPTDMAKWPFEKAGAEWLATRANHVAPKTYQTEKERLAALLRAFAGKRLRDITSSDICGYQLMRRAKVAPKTINLECAVLRMVLRLAKLWAPLSEDYAPLPQTKRGPGRALSPEEESRLFETARTKPRWDAAFYAALVATNTTARGCELRGLRLADVDLLSRTMKIRRVSTKTDAGCRLVPLNDAATRAFARLLERARALGSTAPDHYVFPAFRFRRKKQSVMGARSGYDPTAPMTSWRTAWRSLTKAAGLVGLRFHDLRHHCITRLAEAGVPEQTLMSIAGHVSREMLEHYSHIRIQAKRKAVAALDVQDRTPTLGEAIQTVN